MNPTIPIFRGIIDRRILVNFRVAPDVLEGILPRPFRPKLVHGWGMAGVCLLRLKPEAAKRRAERRPSL